MNSRHRILEDTDFWRRLEFGMSVQPEKERKISRYWIDGFIPEKVSDTRDGVVVEGKVWIGEGRNQGSFAFAASVPQKLLHKRIMDFEYVVTRFSLDEKILQFEVRPMKRQQNQSCDTTAVSAPR